jgi:hypothetical protein
VYSRTDYQVWQDFGRVILFLLGGYFIISRVTYFFPFPPSPQRTTCSGTITSKISRSPEPTQRKLGNNDMFLVDVLFHLTRENPVLQLLCKVSNYSELLLWTILNLKDINVCECLANLCIWDWVIYVGLNFFFFWVRTSSSTLDFIWRTDLLFWC